jgi:hypothetical protein
MVTNLNPEDVLKLVADTELQEFCKLLDIEESMATQRNELANKLTTCSRTRILSALISVNGIWIRMMRDILRHLEQHGVSFRTTGCLLTLPLNDKDTRCYLSPQVADLIATFDPATYKAKSFPDWEQAESKWHNDLRYWIQEIIEDGKPDQRDQERDIVDVYMELRTSGHFEMYEDVVEVDREGINRVFSLWRTLDYLADKLALIDGSNYPTIAVRLSNEVTQFAHNLGREINNWIGDREISYEIKRYVANTKSWSNSWEKRDLFNDQWWQHDRRWDKWKLFVEDVLSLATLESSPELSDLLRLDLLKDRPRLFEVWCMCQILSTYSAMGCIVELQSLTLGKQPLWNLNYSRASEPVARISSDSSQWWLFFQLFQKGPSRANMPDLALLRGRQSSSDVIWIADPKYSEAGGYSRADYLEVAERYRDTFKAEHVWICEFFDRREWFNGACSEKGDRVSILTEVQPQGEGARLLNRELRLLHGFPSQQLILAIDCSGSFSDTLSRMAVKLEAVLAVAEAVVCFADSATEISGRDFAAVQDAAKTIGEGTCLSPLVSTLRALSARARGTDLVLISDEGFSDSSDALRNELEGLFANIETARDEDSLRKLAGALGLG